jgi:hypothetical protein
VALAIHRSEHKREATSGRIVRQCLDGAVGAVEIRRVRRVHGERNRTLVHRKLDDGPQHSVVGQLGNALPTQRNKQSNITQERQPGRANRGDNNLCEVAHRLAEDGIALGDQPAGTGERLVHVGTTAEPEFPWRERHALWALEPRLYATAYTACIQW